MRTKEQMDKLNAFINSIGNPNAPPSSALTAAPLHLQFEPSDFIQLVESLHLNQADELSMYLSAWHRFNDLCHEAQSWDLSPQHTEFLELILQKLNAVKPNDSLLNGIQN